MLRLCFTESSAALGLVSVVDFGMLHMEIIQERLERVHDGYHNCSLTFPTTPLPKDKLF
jgi:translation elongation factor EF-4